MNLDRLAPFGRSLFAVALIAFAIQQVIFGDFVPGRAPEWPAGVPGRLVWAYGTAAIFAASGLAFLGRRWVREAALLTGAVIFGWAFLRNIPPALADRIYGGAWTTLGKALTFFGGALAVAGAVEPRKPGLLVVGRVCLGAFLASSGVQHFLFVPFVATLVPAWIPGPIFWTYFAGVALIAGGIGMNVPFTTRWAAAMSGLMVFLWVFMLHVPLAIAAAPGKGRNEWTAVFEAVAVSGIAFLIAGTARSRG